MTDILSQLARGLGRGVEILGTLGTADLYRQRAKENAQELGNILAEQSIPAYARKGGVYEQTPEEIRATQLKQLAALGTPEALAILGKIAPIAQQTADLGATGELAKRVMAENPGMTFTDALGQVQSGFRQGVMFGGGVATPIPGYGGALGSIGGQKQYGTDLGGLQARMELQPSVEEAVSAAKERATQEEQIKAIAPKALEQARSDIDISTRQTYPIAAQLLDLNAGTIDSPYAAAFQPALKLTGSEKATALDLMKQARLELAAPLAKQLGVNPTDKDFLASLDRIFDINATKQSREAQIKALIRGSDIKREAFGLAPMGNTPTKNLSFSSIGEAEAAKLPKGTEITINGRRAVIE